MIPYSADSNCCMLSQLCCFAPVLEDVLDQSRSLCRFLVLRQARNAILKQVRWHNKKIILWIVTGQTTRERDVPLATCKLCPRRSVIRRCRDGHRRRSWRRVCSFSDFLGLRDASESLSRIPVETRTANIIGWCSL
jgi:hypothetical protein